MENNHTFLLQIFIMMIYPDRFQKDIGHSIINRVYFEGHDRKLHIFTATVVTHDQKVAQTTATETKKQQSRSQKSRVAEEKNNSTRFYLQTKTTLTK